MCTAKFSNEFRAGKSTQSIWLVSEFHRNIDCVPPTQQTSLPIPQYNAGEILVPLGQPRKLQTLWIHQNMLTVSVSDKIGVHTSHELLESRLRTYR